MDEDGGVKVAVGGEAWTFNLLCLAPANEDSSQKVVSVFVMQTNLTLDYTQFNPGDMVHVLDDANEVRRLQEGHGGWVDPMSKVGLHVVFKACTFYYCREIKIIC